MEKLCCVINCKWLRFSVGFMLNAATAFCIWIVSILYKMLQFDEFIVAIHRCWHSVQTCAFFLPFIFLAGYEYDYIDVSREWRDKNESVFKMNCARQIVQCPHFSSSYYVCIIRFNQQHLFALRIMKNSYDDRVHHKSSRRMNLFIIFLFIYLDLNLSFLFSSVQCIQNGVHIFLRRHWFQSLLLCFSAN